MESRKIIRICSWWTWQTYQKNLSLSCSILQNQFNPVQSMNGVCVSKSFPIHSGKNCCALFSGICIPAQPGSLSMFLCERLCKMVHRGGAAPHAWLYKNSIIVRTDGICLYMDGSATAETTWNYTGLKDLGSQGFSNMKFDQQRQPEHMCWPFLSRRIIWRAPGI